MDKESLMILLALVAVWLLLRVTKNIGIKTISPTDAKKRLDTESGIILLDVRTENEYLESHIPKSVLIPTAKLQQEAKKKLPNTNSEIFVYCASGSRSATAVKKLKIMGYTNVYNLGGINRWPYKKVSRGK